MQRVTTRLETEVLPPRTEDVRMLRLKGTTIQDVMDEILEADLFSDEVKAQVVRAKSVMRDQRRLAAYVWEVVVKPKMAELGGDAPDLLFDWDELLEEMVPECFVGAFEKCRRVIAATGGIEQGIRKAEARINGEALEILERVEAGHQKIRGEIAALGRYQVDSHLDKEQKEVVKNLLVAAQKAQGLGKELVEESEMLAGFLEKVKT